MEFYGIEKLSLVDFDQKISCTLFTSACNFRCPFCHNSSLVISNDAPSISKEAIYKYLKSRVGILDAVVITGGEPTLHPDLVDEIRKIKELGYLIKLDTNGTNPEMVKLLVNEHLVDFIAMDIKNSQEKYALTTGLKSLDLTKINETIEFLKEDHIPYEFRTTLINEYHTKEDIEKIGIWLKGARSYRLQRFIDNEYCIKHGLHEVNKNDAEEFLSIASKYINDVKLRSYD